MNKKLITLIVAVIVIAIIGVVIFMVTSNNENNEVNNNVNENNNSSNNNETNNNNNNENTEINDDTSEESILIVYFSESGNTETIANYIHDEVGGDLVKLEPVNPYPEDYNELLDVAQEEQRSDARPEIATIIDNIDQYDTIFIGYPNWWATIPMPIATFLESYDFSNKVIIPFCSHGGGGLGQSVTDIAKLAPNSRIGEPLSIHYSGGSALESDIDEWLESNGIDF